MCGSSVSYSFCMCVHYYHCYAITACARQLVCLCAWVHVRVCVCMYTCMYAYLWAITLLYLKRIKRKQWQACKQNLRDHDILNARKLAKRMGRWGECTPLPPIYVPCWYFFHASVLLFLYISHWTYIAPSLIASSQTHSVWSLEYLPWRAFQQINI